MLRPHRSASSNWSMRRSGSSQLQSEDSLAMDGLLGSDPGVGPRFARQHRDADDGEEGRHGSPANDPAGEAYAGTTRPGGVHARIAQTHGTPPRRWTDRLLHAQVERLLQAGE